MFQSPQSTHKISLADRLYYILKKEGPLPTEEIVMLSGEARLIVRSRLGHMATDGRIIKKKCSCCGIGVIYEVRK